MVTILLTVEEAKMLVALAESTISDYTIKDIAGHGKYGGMIKAAREIVEKAKANIKRDDPRYE